MTIKQSVYTAENFTVQPIGKPTTAQVTMDLTVRPGNERIGVITLHVAAEVANAMVHSPATITEKIVRELYSRLEGGFGEGSSAGSVRNFCSSSEPSKE